MSDSADRLTAAAGQETMTAMVTTGQGGYDKLVLRTVRKPQPKPGQAVLQVLAAGVNNTEINTRLGWYSSDVADGTNAAAGGDGSEVEQKADGGWNAATPFPFIQGTDCCGRVVAIGDGVDPAMIGERALVRSCMRPNGFGSAETVWMGSDFDGAFAQFVAVPAGDVFPVRCGWSDAELATIPCAYGTAETMLNRVRLSSGERVLVTGASGGVGSAALQLARRRGAEIVAVAGRAKHDRLRSLGVHEIYDRGDDLIDALGEEAVDVVVDNVAGPGFPTMLKLLRRGGRYASSGAIAGPIVALDMRDMYLKDITLFGSTGWDEPVFPNIIRYIEDGEIAPLLAAAYALADIAKAQADFLEKTHFGNFALIPPEATS